MWSSEGAGLVANHDVLEVLWRSTELLLCVDIIDDRERTRLLKHQRRRALGHQCVPHPHMHDLAPGVCVPPHLHLLCESAGLQVDPTRHGATKVACFFRPTDLVHLPPHPPHRSRAPWRPSPPPASINGRWSWEVTGRFSSCPLPSTHTRLLYLPGFPTT